MILLAPPSPPQLLHTDPEVMEAVCGDMEGRCRAPLDEVLDLVAQVGGGLVWGSGGL